MRFSSDVARLLSDFVLMEHSNFGSPNTIDLVGTDQSNNLYVKSYNSVGGRFDKSTRIRGGNGDKIVNVITQNFFSDGPSHLVTSKTGDASFTNEIHGKEGLRMKLGNSTATPFIITSPDSLEPLIVMATGSDVHFYSIEDGKLQDQDAIRPEIDGTLSPAHTSAFIDLSGDLRPNLVMNMVSGSNNYIAIYDFYSEPKRLVQRLPLPKSIGPTLYFDSNGSQCYDLVYVSVEDGASFVNIHRNLSVPELKKVNVNDRLKYFDAIRPDTIYSDKPNIKFNLLKLTDGKAVIRDASGMPTGLFLADLESSGEMKIFVTMQIGGRAVLRCLELDNDVLRLSRYDSAVSEYTNVLGVSVADISDRGKNDLLINHVVDGVPVLVCKKIKSPDGNCKLSALTLFERRNSGRTRLPGATCMVLYNNGSSWRKASQMTSTSYPSLQLAGSYIGLGPTNFFITFVLVRTNATRSSIGSFSIDNVIVPNTSLVLIASEEKWTVKNFFLMDRYCMVTFCLAGLLVANMLVLVYLTVKERHVLRRSEIEKNIMGPVFSAL